jgi:hypothetical protein
VWNPPDIPTPVTNDVGRRIDDTDNDDGTDWTVGGTSTPGALNPGQTGDPPPTQETYEMKGNGTTCCEVTIENVFPWIVVPPELEGKQVDENDQIDFVGIEIDDPALMEKTEEFWYRYDLGDGTPITPWTKKTTITHATLEDFEQDPGDWPWDPWVAVSPPYFEEVNTNAAHDGMYGLEVDQGSGNMWYYTTEVEVGAPGDKLSMWVQPPATGFSGGRAYLGFAATASGCWDFSIGPNTNELLIHRISPYGSFQTMATTSYTFTHSDWYKAEIEFISLTEIVGRLYDTDGTTLLAELPYTDAGGFDGGLPGGVAFRMFDYGGVAHHWYLDTYESPVFDPVIPTFSHIYGDNGIYYVDIQIIDDDMNWDLSGESPVYVGPEGEEDEWISHNILPIEVLNVDPTISPLRAYVEVDLSLCVDWIWYGGGTVTMELYENGVLIGNASIYKEPGWTGKCWYWGWHRCGCHWWKYYCDGGPDVVTIPAVFEMTKEYSYELIVTYDPEFEHGFDVVKIKMRFPDGSCSKMRECFRGKHGEQDWMISNDELKGMLMGHDIIFTADADDPGTDDLAFVWNFGDGFKYGIHLYSNVNGSLQDSTTAIDAQSDEVSLLFDQIGDDRDPWFDRPANDERSPHGNGDIHVDDTITHKFGRRHWFRCHYWGGCHCWWKKYKKEPEPSYYYYVMLLVMDDDVGDGYPSYQNFLNGGGYDMEFLEIDLDYAKHRDWCRHFDWDWWHCH